MNKTTRLRAIIGLAGLLAIALLALIGCGGGGGGLSAGGLNVFLTDDMSTGFDQIWVTVHKVEVQSSSGAFVTAFDDPSGVTVDVTNLSDGAERFLFIGARNVPAGDYTGVRITMSTDLTVFATSSSTGEACVFDPSLDIGGGLSAANFAFAAPVTIGTGSHVVVDFDLPNWNKVGNVVTPAFKQGDDSTIGDGARHERDDYHGTVSSLTGTAPDQSFLLTGKFGTFKVTTTASTLVFNEDGSSNPALGNNKKVEVTGQFDTGTGALVASVIKIDDGVEDGQQVKGATSNVDGTLGTFDVAPGEVEGFVPSADVVHIATTDTTTYFGKGGVPMTKDDFFAALTGGVAVEVEGTYASGTNTLTATKAKLHAEDANDDGAEAQGTAGNINTVDHTFDLTLTRWFGFGGSAGMVVPVVTDVSTTYEGLNGSSMTAADFFAALANGATVEVEGTFDGTVFNASEVKLKSEDNNPQDEVKGAITSSTVGTGVIHVSVLEWFGFDTSLGADVTIQTGVGTTFQNADGIVVSQGEFFGLLSTGTKVDAQGTFAAGVFTATRARIKS